MTGQGTYKTLQEIKKEIPLKIKYFKSGSRAFDWKIPDEWTLSRAYVSDAKNNILIDTKKNSMHIAGYSKKIKKTFFWKEIKNKFFYIKNKNYLPYRTLYYKKDWGFCVNQSQYSLLKKEKKLKIVIDATFKKGKMYYGELFIKGKSKKEILLSTYICHPQMANDNLSGIVTLTFLTKFILKKKRKFSYRILFCPETIGAIAYLKKNSQNISNIFAAVVITTCGGPGKFSYKESFQREHEINYIVRKTFDDLRIKFTSYPFIPLGSDERQFSSYPYRINTVSIFKNKYYEYKYYHTSKDDLNYVTPSNLIKSLEVYKKFIKNIEKTIIFKKKIIGGETMLNKYGLSRNIGGIYKNERNFSSFILNILFYSDGLRTTSDISRKIKVQESKVLKVSNYLEKKNILYRIV